MIVFAAIVPHPPESIPTIGTMEDLETIKKTLSAFDVLRKGLEEAAPDTIVIISPHAYLEPYSFVINSASDLVGGFEKFGVDKSYQFKNDIEISDKISYACHVDDLPAHLHQGFLDHGALIPLYHLTKNIQPKIVHLSFSLMSYQLHFNYGEIISRIVGKTESKRVAIIASGDLSHRLAKNSPMGFSPNAVAFDRAIIHHLGENNLLSIMSMHKDIVDEAAECGIRSFMILFGIIHGEKYSFDLLSYEGPFGVGYLTARLI